MEPTDGQDDEIKSRILYETDVKIDSGCYLGFLLLYDDHLSLIAMKGGQEDRVRRYSWKYNQIKRATKHPAYYQQNSLLVVIKAEPNQEEQKLDLMFSTTDGRDSFNFRINTLRRIYSPKVKPKLQLNNDEALLCPKATQTKNSSNFPEKINSKIGSKPTLDNILNNHFDDMFAVENLVKMAKASSICLDNHVNEVGSVEGQKYVIKAEAKLAVKLSIDLSAITDAQSISDKEARLEKIRNLIEMDSNVCELNFL